MHKKRFSNNIKWQFAANSAQAALGGGYLLVLGSGLGAADFGMYSILIALISVMGLLFEMRIQDVVAKDLCDIGDEHDKSWQDGLKLVDLFVVEVVGRVIPVLGLVIFSPFFAQMSNLPVDAVELVTLAALGFLAGKAGIGTSSGLLRVLGRTDLIALFVTADWALRLFFTLLMLAYGGLTIANALWVVMVVGGIINVCQLLVSAKEYISRGGAFFWEEWSIWAIWGRMKHDRRLISANLGISSSDMMAKDLDITIISLFVSIDKVGLYKMAKSLVQVIWRAIDPFYLAIMPEVQRLCKRDESVELRKMLVRTSGLLFLLALILAIICYVLVLTFGVRILGPGYDQLPSLVLVMLIWVVICAPLVWGHPLAVAVGHPEVAVGGGILGTLAGFSSFLVLTPRYGLTGAAVAWNITLVVMFFFIAGIAAYIFSKNSRIV